MFKFKNSIKLFAILMICLSLFSDASQAKSNGLMPSKNLKGQGWEKAKAPLLAGSIATALVITYIYCAYFFSKTDTPEKDNTLIEKIEEAIPKSVIKKLTQFIHELTHWVRNSRQRTTIYHS